MNDIRIQERSQRQIDVLEDDPRFRSIQPVLCSDCGNDRGLKKRIFHITGKMDDDDDSGLIAYHMKERHGIEGYIMRAVGGKEYLEAAVCPKCGSTRIVFDMVMDLGNIADRIVPTDDKEKRS